MRARRLAALLGCAALITIALATASAQALELTTYGYGNARLGVSPGPVGISTGTVSRLYTAWRVNLPGAIDGQALVVNGVRIRRHATRNLVLVGTEHGLLAAIEKNTGRILWERRLGTRSISPDCQASPDGEFGVTGTMVVDQAAGRVYAVDANGLAWALELANGRVAHGWPVRVHPPGPEFDWGALTISRGWLYVPVASLCDLGLYYGGIHAVDLANPRTTRRWLTTGGTGAWAGGIWGWGGLSIDDETGEIFAATGNSIGTNRENDGYAENVVRLSPTLKFEQSNYPLRPPFQITDRDFGTAPVLIRQAGCPLQAVAINKDGYLYRYSANFIGQGPRQRIRVADSTPTSIPLYGMPAFDPATRRLVLVSPTTPPGSPLSAGIQTFVLSPHCQFFDSWQQGFDAPDAGSAPTIAQGVLYIGTGRNGVLRAYRLSDGQELWSHGLGATSFAAPAVADGMVFVGDWNGVFWAFRAPR